MAVTVLIPAYKPGSDFPSFVAELIARGLTRIVIVDDGSGPSFRTTFDLVASRPHVRVCRHALNLGKGAALKTGFNAILCDDSDTSVVVTADADGQHHPDDVLAVAAAGEANRSALVLGVRAFDRDVPLRSRVGNAATRFAMRLFVGQALKDTQTGLRAIPFEMLPTMMRLGTNGYEFELDMIVTARNKRVPIVEVPIRTIYLNANASSHFNPLLDSMRIYFVLLRFVAAAMSTAVIDNALFALIFASTHSIAMSLIGARLVATTYNFIAVKRVVFKSRTRRFRQVAAYGALVAGSGIASFALIHAFVALTGLDVVRAKLMGEAILFVVNFLVQRDVIFRGPDEGTAADAPAGLRREAGTPPQPSSFPR